jgi:hypothetical protein
VFISAPFTDIALHMQLYIQIYNVHQCRTLMLSFSNPTKTYASHLITTSQKLSKFQSEKQGEGFARGLGRRAQFSPFVQQGMETPTHPAEEQQGMEDLEAFQRRSSRGWRLELVRWRSNTGWRLELIRWRSSTGWRLKLVRRRSRSSSREQGIVLC